MRRSKIMYLEKTFNPQQLLAILRALTYKHEFYVAFSGGLDSMTLLHGLAAARQDNPEVRITAIHVNHGLSDNSSTWTEFCRKICAVLQVEFIAQTVAVKANAARGESLEAVARKLRYQVFAKLVPPQAALLTAHQADDQAETLLLQALRGSGVKGLAAMPQKSIFSGIELIRPLLHFTRAMLEQYAQDNNLQWINDESNFDIAFDRNYLRHEIIPVLRKNWPGLIKSFNRVAINCAEADHLLQVLAAKDCASANGDVAKTLSVAKVLELDTIRQSNLLRYWLYNLQFPLPSKTKIIEIQKSILHCRSDAKAVVQWDGVEIRRFHDDLYAIPTQPTHKNTAVLSWDLRAPLLLPSGIGILQCSGFKDFDVNELAYLQNITVRFRQGGERCFPRGRKHAHELKKLFQEWRVPYWQRDRIPLVYRGEQLMVIVGYCICEGWDERLSLAVIAK